MFSLSVMDWGLLAIVGLWSLSLSLYVAARKVRPAELHAFDRCTTEPLRIALALFVIFTHIPVWRCLQQGTAAVAVFFFLSGYGMVKSLEVKGESYLSGLTFRTFVKLFTPAIICSIPWVLKMWYSANYGPNGYEYNLHIITKHIFMGDFGYILPSSWFPMALFLLSFIFVIAAKAFRFRGKKLLIASFIGTASLYCILRFVLNWRGFWWLSLWGFNIGMAYCLYEQKINEIMLKLKGLMLLVFFVIWALTRSFQPMHSVFVGQESNCVIGFMLAFGLCVLPQKRNRLVQWISSISYEIYISHVVVFGFLCSLHIGDVASIAILFLSLLPCAWVVHRISSTVSDTVLQKFCKR